MLSTQQVLLLSSLLLSQNIPGVSDLECMNEPKFRFHKMNVLPKEIPALLLKFVLDLVLLNS